MNNFFLRHELDFNEWVQAGFPDINPLSQDFLLHLQDDTKERKLWDHQMIGVQRVVYCYEKIGIRDVLLNIVLTIPTPLENMIGQKNGVDREVCALK